MKNGSDFLRGRSIKPLFSFSVLLLKLQRVQIWVSSCSHTLFPSVVAVFAPGLMRTTLCVAAHWGQSKELGLCNGAVKARCHPHLLFWGLVLLCARWLSKQGRAQGICWQDQACLQPVKCCMDGTSPARNPSGSALIAFSSTLILFIAISFCEDKLNPFFLIPFETGFGKQCESQRRADGCCWYAWDCLQGPGVSLCPARAEQADLVPTRGWALPWPYLYALGVASRNLLVNVLRGCRLLGAAHPWAVSRVIKLQC